MKPHLIPKAKAKLDQVFNESVIENRPEHALLAAKALSIHSEIESLQPIIVASMLGVHAEPVARMLSCLTSAAARYAAIEAAANAELRNNEADRLLFLAVIDIAKKAGKARNFLAHWLWGYCPDWDDALLLKNPETRLDGEIAFIKAVHQSKQNPTELVSPDWSGLSEKVRVYTKANLEGLVMRFTQVRSHMGRLRATVDQLVGLSDRSRQKLLAWPEIQEGITRIKKAQKMTP